jgi:hypothetical protein
MTHGDEGVEAACDARRGAASTPMIGPPPPLDAELAAGLAIIRNGLPPTVTPGLGSVSSEKGSCKFAQPSTRWTTAADTSRGN